METISVSKLKTYLSAELKRVESGVELTVVDHKRPVAKLSPIHADVFFVREATCRYEYESLSALITADPLQFLEKVLAGIALATPLLVEAEKAGFSSEAAVVQYIKKIREAEK